MFEPVPRLVFISMRNGLLAGALGIVFLLVLYYHGSASVFVSGLFRLSDNYAECFCGDEFERTRDYHQQGLLSFGEGHD
jgi:hypothetical protein